MARPKKEGLDYFPLDVDMDQDDKIALIQAKHGLIGFSIVVKLLMKIYKNSYYYEWSEKEQLLFSSRVNVDINLLKEVINDCINWGLFDEEIYKNHKILTSKGIQERYMEAVLRRKEIMLTKEYLKINPSSYVRNSRIKIKIVDASELVINVDINPNNADNNPQSKSNSKSKRESNSKSNNNSAAEEEGQNDDSKNGIGGSLPYSRSCEFFVRNFNNYSTYIQDEIAKWEVDLSEEIVIESMKIALKRNAKNFGFFESILKEWYSEGLKTIEDVQAYENAKREKREQNKQIQQPRVNFRANNRQDKLPKWVEDQRKNEKLGHSSAPQEPPTSNGNGKAAQMLKEYIKGL